MGIIAIIGALGLLYRHARGFCSGRRAALISASVTWGVCQVVITEVLSFFHALSNGWVLLGWLMVCAGATAAMLYRKPAPRQSAIHKSPARPFAVAIALVVLLLLGTGIGGVFSAPNNWDSMIYHLPRVMHWMHNRSLQPYPTNTLTQLYHAPWAETVILHLQLLTGGDRFAFSVSWLSLIGSLVVASRVANLIGGDSRAEVLAAVFVATLPSAVLQSESTQNNLAVSFWLLCAAEAILSLDRVLSQLPSRTTLVERQWLSPIARGGAALGLAALTKGTAYFFVLPMASWLLLVAFRAGWRRGIAIILTAFTVALALNVGHAWRNESWCHDPVMPAIEKPHFRVDQASCRLSAANVIRNLALHFNTPSLRLNRFQESSYRKALALLGVSADDSRITAPGQSFELLRAGHEDSTGNPFHLLLIICAMVAVGANSRLPSDGRRNMCILLAVALLGFLSFCAAVKWQPYHARLHLPAFCLAAAPVAVTASYLRSRRTISILVGLFLSAGLLLVAVNPSHALVGPRSIFIHTRHEQYFIGRQDLLDSYERAVNFLGNEHGTIGVGTKGNSWEYPLWIFVHDRRGTWPDIVATPSSPVAPPVTQEERSHITSVIILDQTIASEVDVVRSNFWSTRSFGKISVRSSAPNR